MSDKFFKSIDEQIKILHSRGLSIEDEVKGRDFNKPIDLTVTGTLGVLMRAKKNGLIDDLSNDIESLKRAGMYISDKLIKQIMSTLNQK